MAQEDGFETLAIHAGQEPDPLTGAVVPPIYQVSTYKQDGVGGLRAGGYEYSRTANPTRTALEQCLAALDGGARALAFASGMAAEDCLLRTVCAPGDHVLIPDDAYGGTFRLFSRVYERWGVSYAPVPAGDPAAVREALAARPARVIWTETPTNPLLAIADISALAAIAREAGALLVVDSTFASPYLQRPIALGADVVVHSTTKYLGGHSDVVGGAAITADPEIAAGLRFVQNAVGAVPAPLDCFLVHRGLRTLHLRMAAHAASAAAVREFLRSRDDVADVRWPGFSGMVSFRHPDAAGIAERTQLFTLAESLGGVESLIEVPAAMTHQSVADSTAAVPPDLVRLSCGIEDPADLVEDLAQALAHATAAARRTVTA
jgi:cystathionine gamma-synthase